MRVHETDRKWMNKIMTYRDVLSREEEKELVHRYYTLGEKEAGEELVLANQRLIMPFAAGYARRTQGMPLEDLFSEGTLGLLHALKKYDPAKGYRFMTYAKAWVRSYINTYVIQKRNIVHTNTTPKLRAMYSRFRKEQLRIEREVVKEFGESAIHYTEEVERRMADLFKVSVKKIREFEYAGRGVISIDTIGTLLNENGKPLGHIPQDDGVDPIELQTKDTLAKILREEIEELEPTLRDIAKRRFNIGFDVRRHDSETFAKLAQRYDSCPEQIRQLEKRALKKLRVRLRGKLDKGTLEDLAHQ